MSGDDGYAVHFTELKPGTPVRSSDGEEVGKLVETLDNYRENIMDGLVLETPSGERKFVDAPEVERTAERAVTLNITASQAARLGAPPSRRRGARGLFGTILGKRGR